MTDHAGLEQLAAYFRNRTNGDVYVYRDGFAPLVHGVLLAESD